MSASGKTSTWFCVGLALVASIALLDCDNGGGNGSVVVTVKLGSDEPCYGINIDVPDEELAAEASCVGHADALALGCETAMVAGDEHVLHLSVRGCFVPAGTSLFTCTVPARSNALVEFSDVRCGCGCADDCPTDPAAVVCNSDGEECESRDAVSADAAPAVEPRPARGSQSTATTSSTLACGTCCDVVADANIGITEEALLSEVEFDVLLPSSQPECSLSCEIAPQYTSPSRVVQLDRNRVHVCIASHDGVRGEGELASCQGSNGGDELQLSNIRTLDTFLRNSRPPDIGVSRH